MLRTPQRQTVGQRQAQRAQHAAHNVDVVGAKQHKIPGFGPHAVKQVGHAGRADELGQNRADAPVLAQGGPRHALCPQRQRLLRQLVDVRPGQPGPAGHTDGAHHTRLCRLFKDREPAPARPVSHVGNGQVKAQIGLVAAVTVHGLEPGHPHKRPRQGQSGCLLKNVAEQPLEVL